MALEKKRKENERERMSLTLDPETWRIVRETARTTQEAREVAKKTGIPFETVQSIRETRIQEETRRIVSEIHHSNRRGHGSETIATELLRRFTVEGKRLKEMWEGTGMTPYIAAKMIIEEIQRTKTTTKDQEEEEEREKMRMMRELEECAEIDDMNGPNAEKEKRIRGKEHEMKIETWLRRKRITFKGEEELRKEGYSKTPDFLLDIPQRVKKTTTSGDMIINWIESKALFGDATTHEKYSKEQLRSYRTRYGPGCVIYWFGISSDISIDPEILVLTSFPSMISPISFT